MKSAIVVPAGLVKESVWYVLLTARAVAGALRPMPPVQFVSAATPAMRGGRLPGVVGPRLAGGGAAVDVVGAGLGGGREQWR